MDKNKINKIINVICLTILIIDSGGGLGIRNISFLIIFLFGFYGLIKYKNYNNSFIKLYLIFIISLMPAVIISLLNSISFLIIIGWILSFMLIPFFYFYVKGSNLSSQCFVYAGGIFSILVIFLFIGRILDFSVANSVNEYITSHSDGFFGNKKFLSGDILPNVYFQGTLSVVICGCLSLKNKNYIFFLLILLGLILAPSRFGFMVLVLWALFLYIRKSPSRIGLLPLIIIGIFLLIKNLAFGIELISAFNGESDAVEIRNGHLTSIYEIFEDNPLYFFFGQGPGSIFFSKGIYALTDNIEISQLEFIRKYGFFSFLFFCLFYFFPLFSRYKSHIYLKGTLIIYFFVSFSNPVLFSLFSMLFLAFVYVEIFDNKTTFYDSKKEL